MFLGWGWSQWGQFFEFGFDLLQDIGQVGFDQGRGDAVDSQADLFEDVLAGTVGVCLVCMDAPVYFDDQAVGSGEKVNDEGTNGLLPAEFDASQFPASEGSP